VATGADTSLNLPNLPDSDPEPTAAITCYLYWVVRHELFGSIAAIIASFIVAVFAKSSRILNACIFLLQIGVPRTAVLIGRMSLPLL
jgi:hypothetical protein